MAGTVSNPINSADPTVIAADRAASTNNALWYTFGGIGRAYLVRRGSDSALMADSASVHGYATIEQAYKNPNTVNVISQPTITQWDSQASLPIGGGTLGMIETVNITAPTGSGSPSVSTPQNPTTAGISDVLGGFNIANWFVRIGEILLGLVLVGVGVARITGAENAISKVASKIPVIPV